MAISFVAAGTVASGTNPTVTVPTGYAAGDLLIIAITGTTVTTPTGWTLLSSNATAPICFVYYKTASASESSVVMTSASTNTRVVMVAYRGQSGLDVTGTFKQAAAGNSTIATNSLTTTTNNDYIISFYAQTTIAQTWTAPASTNTRVNASGTASVRGILLVDELQTSAGATTVRTATTSAATIALTSFAFSISPATSAANNGSFFFIM
jgi:hypothetical protein